MVNVLSPTFTDVESQKAVYDRFFFDPYRQDIELLWRHEELLNHDVGVLVQAHIEPDGSFAEIDEMADKPTVSLLLDARQRDQQHLVMQLETAQPYGPRAIRQLITSPQKVEAWEFSIDAQGGVRSTKSTHPHQV